MLDLKRRSNEERERIKAHRNKIERKKTTTTIRFCTLHTIGIYENKLLSFLSTYSHGDLVKCEDFLILLLPFHFCECHEIVSDILHLYFYNFFSVVVTGRLLVLQ